MKTCHFIILILSLSILGSCSIEKRLYNNGYSVLKRKSIRHSSHDEIANQPFIERIASSHETEKHAVPIQFSVLFPTDSIEKEQLSFTEEKDTINFYSAKNHSIIRDEIKTETRLSELKKVTKKPLQYRGSGRGAGLRLFVAASLCVLLGLTLVYNPGYYGFGLFFGFTLLAIGVLLLLAAIIYVTFHGF